MMFRIWVMLAACAVSSAAVADIFKCTDSSGHVTYSNLQAKGCSRLVSGGSEAPAAAKGGKSSVGNPSPANFPKVDAPVQRARDDDRRKILDNELQSEQRELDKARKELEQQAATVEPDERNVSQRCQQVCTPAAGGQTNCKQVCTPVAAPGINSVKVEQRLQPYRDKVALHERNIESLKKEIGNLR